MSITVDAVYENGAFRPTRALPLDLVEGESVAITVEKATTAEPPLSEDEVCRRIQAAKSVQEWIEITRLLPADDGGYDILKSLDENRKWSGGRPILPENGASL